MLTPDKNFRMWASTKTALALSSFKDAHDRGAYKRAMIDAQLTYEAAKRAALKSKEKKDFGQRGAVAPEVD